MKELNTALRLPWRKSELIIYIFSPEFPIEPTNVTIKKLNNDGREAMNLERRIAVADLFFMEKHNN